MGLKPRKSASSSQRILMLTLFPREGNGSATVVRDLAATLAATSDVMAVYVDTDRGEMPGYQSHYWLVDDFPVLRTHPKSVGRRRFVDLSANEVELFLEGLLATVLEAVSKFRPTVLHVHHGWLGALVARQVQEKTGIPYLVQFHGTELEVREDYEQFDTASFAALDAQVTRGLAGAACFVTISPTEHARTLEFVRTKGLPQPVHMIPNGYDEAIFFPQAPDLRALYDRFEAQSTGHWDPSATKTVLFVGRFVGFKGIEYLLRAAQSYGGPGVQTLLCGDGELRANMEQLSEKLQLERVAFLGHVDHFRDLPELYNLADVLVVPSKGEPFGLVAIEAMGCGTPVVGSRSGALPYIIESAGGVDDLGSGVEETPLGLIVPFGEPEQIARGIKIALGGGFDPVRMSQQVCDLFSVHTQSARYAALYGGLL